MKEPKEYTCARVGCTNKFVKYKSTDKCCSYACHSIFVEDKKKGKSYTSSKAKRKIIKAISPKKAKELAKYRPIRDEYLDEHRVCQVAGCWKQSTNLHHKAGRTGYWDEASRLIGLKLLWDIRFFMACCETCHPNRIHMNPDYAGWARENGYIIDRE